MHDSFHYNLSVVHSFFFRTMYAEIVKECPDITPGQPKIIEYLMKYPCSRQKDIALACAIEPPTLTNILARMESLELVERKRDANNNRAVTVKLTVYGMKQGRKIEQICKTLEQKLFSHFSEEEYQNLLSLLKKTQRELTENSSIPDEG